MAQTQGGMMKKAFGISILTAVLAAGAAAFDFDEETVPYPYEIPLGLDAPPVPASNPLTHAKVELGKLLYFDKRLSKDDTISCATCHDPAKGWTDQAPVSTGIRGQKGARSAPSVLNSAYYETQFWDGRAESLEAQAVGPIENPIEMGFTHDGVVEKLSGIAGYRAKFKKAFGDDAVTIDRVGMAIASFERTVLTGNSPYDRYEAGKKKAMSSAAQRGMSLYFGKANCSVCHSGKNFSDSQFHNIGVGMDAKKPDLGRYDATKNDADKGAFKTPTLRNLKYTAPYMHDGSQKTLAEVVEFYDIGGHKNEWLSKDMRPLGMTAAEKKDLIAFLNALNGDQVKIKPPKKFPQ
jgi:cytochrome c peroxidase